MQRGEIYESMLQSLISTLRYHPLLFHLLSPCMAPPMEEMLVPVLSTTLILNCDNLEGECNAAQVGEGDEEEKSNLIDEHTKQ